MSNVSPNNAAEPDHWSPDELIPFGKYLLLDRISVGATAVLYRGRTLGEAGFERLVAVKRLLPHMVGDEEFVRTFVKEAKTAARLAHTNICPIFELGKVGESMYMTMEYIAGKDLGKISKKLREMGESVPPAVAAYISSKLCDALDYAHNLKNVDGDHIGIIHRDISPPNILLSYEGQVKLVDFGLAKAVGQAQQTSIDAVKHKLNYMSPEMVKGGVVDQRSDLFGLGVCLYEMITSRQLFEGKDELSTLKLVSAASIPPPSGFMEDVPEELEIIAMRALERDPEDRWQSAEELNLVLQSYLVKEHPGYGARQLSEWLISHFGTEMKREQERLNLLLEASRRPGIIEERRKFFTSPAGAAAIAKAEVMRRMSGAPKTGDTPVDSEEGQPVAPTPLADKPAAELREVDEEIEELDDFEVIDESTPVRPLNLTAINEEPTPYNDKEKNNDVFEDDPTFFFQSVFAEPAAFEEDATQIFFNKEEGIGIADIYKEPGRGEDAQTPVMSSPASAGLALASPEIHLDRSDEPKGRSTTAQMRAVTAPVWRSVYSWVMAFGLGLLLVAIGSIIFLSLRRPEVGSIEISTNPIVSARVLLDDVERGRAPMRMDGVPVGLRHLEIRADGYPPVKRDVNLTKGVTVVLEVPLSADAADGEQKGNNRVGADENKPSAKEPSTNKPDAAISGSSVAGSASPAAVVSTAGSQSQLTEGILAIDSSPWARVFLDYKDTGGNTPVKLRVEPGDHWFGLQTPDGKMHAEKVTVKAGQTVVISRHYGPK
jgi:serine/threonine protein kinase